MSSIATEDAVEASNLDRILVEQGEHSRFWSREFVELLVVQFAFGLGFSVFYLLPKFLRTELGATGTQIGLVMGIALVSAVVTTPVAAWWLGRGARRAPALLGLLVLSGSAIAFTQVSRIGVFLLGLRALQGIAFCLFGGAVVTRAAELVPNARLAQAMGFVGLAALVTNALSPLISEPLALRYGWSLVFLIAASFGVLAMLVTTRLGDARHETESMHGRRQTVAGIGRALWGVLYATAICGVALGVLFTYTQPLALERGAQHVGRLFSGYVIGATTVRLLLSSLADRIGRRRVAVLGLAVYSAVVVLTWCVTPLGLLGAGLVFGVAHGVVYPALNALSLEGATVQSRGRMVSYFGAAFNIGHAASVLGLGVVADWLGYATVYFGTALITLTGAVVLARSA